ncbi:MAG: hypothetical protein WDN08_06355 [Rhizomicrobium sp.]
MLMSGIGRHEVERDGQQMQAPEDVRRGDGEIALGLAVLAGGGAFGFLDLLQDLLAGLDIGAAGVGQAHLAAGTDEDAGLQMRFELGDVAADGGDRDVQAARSRGEASGLHDRQKHRHGVEAVHRRQLSGLPEYPYQDCV